MAPATKPPAKSASKTASKPASKTASKPASKTASKPASKPATKPASKPATKPATKAATKPATKATTKPATKSKASPSRSQRGGGDYNTGFDKYYTNFVVNEQGRNERLLDAEARLFPFTKAFNTRNVDDRVAEELVERYNMTLPDVKRLLPYTSDAAVEQVLGEYAATRDLAGVVSSLKGARPGLAGEKFDVESHREQAYARFATKMDVVELNKALAGMKSGPERR